MLRRRPSFLSSPLPQLPFLHPRSPAYSSCKRTPPPLPAQSPPEAKRIPFTASAHGRTWDDPYRWMSNTGDPDLLDHLNHENSYAEAFMVDTLGLRRRLAAEMRGRMPPTVSTPPEPWGPWGGGGDHSWHKDGTRSHKLNSVYDFAACAMYLINEGYVHKNLLGAIGCSAGGLLVGATINMYPDLFCAAILKVPFLDICNTMLDPTLPLTVLDYEEFGDPRIQTEFETIHSYSPYDNITSGVCYPSTLVTASFHDSRVGVWEAAKWVARVRENTCPACSRSVILKTNMSGGHFSEGGRFLHCEDTTFDYAFLIKVMGLIEHHKQSEIL